MIFIKKLTLQIEFDSVCYYIVKFKKQKPNQPPVTWKIFCLINFKKKDFQNI